MNRIAILFLISVTALAASWGIRTESKAQETKQSGPLFPVEQNGKYGYINRTGKYVWGLQIK